MPAVSSPLPTRSQIEAWTVAHLEAGSTWLPGHAQVWFDAGDKPYRAIERADWEGPAANAARDVYKSIRTQSFAGSRHLESAAQLLIRAADQIAAAKQRATRAIADAETEGFTVSEDLSVSFDATGLTAAEAAAKAVDLEQHTSEIHSAATNLANTEDFFARSITTAASQLHDIIPAPATTPGEASMPTVQAASFTPKLAPADTLPHNNGSGNAGSPFDDPTTHGQQGEGTPSDDKSSADEPGQKSPYDDAKKPDNNKSEDETESDRAGSPYDDAPDNASTTAGTEAPDDEFSPYDSAPLTPTPMPNAGGAPMSPVGSGGGVPKAPSVPSSPLSSLTNPASSLGSGASSAAGGGGQGVAPAAFDKPLQAASSSLLNNAPAPFTPPPAAASSGGGGGAPAPMTSPPPAAAVQQAAPLAGPAPAAAAPIAAPPPAVGGAGTPMGGGMLPPLMSSPAGGGMGGSPPPMTAPPPPPAVPAGPGAGVSASAPVIPVTAAERVRANIARVTGNTHGRVASDARALCAALHAATKNRPEVMWCVGGRLDGALLVSNNIGLGWLPSNVKLPPPDGVLRVSRHVFGHDQVEWSLRRDWVGHPVRAVRGYARATGDDVVVLACFEQAIDRQFDDVNGVQLDLLSESQIPAVGILAGVDRLQVVNPVLAEEITTEGVAALVAKLPSAMGNSSTDDAAPDRAAADGLWLNVTTSMAVSVDAHLEAWTLFCVNQLAASAHNLRRAADDVQARELYADYAYWQWNLEQLSREG